MGLTLATNVGALNTQRYLGISSTNAQQSLSQLSSGHKLNNASDDPAGYAIAFKLSVKSASISTSMDNGNQALAMLQVAQGGMEQIGNILTQLKQIATQAASSNTDAAGLASLEQERVFLQTEITAISQNTKYGATQLLQGGNTLATTLTVASGVVGIDASGVPGAANAVFTLSATTAAGITTLTLTSATASQTITLMTPTGFGTSTVNFGSALGLKLTVNNAIGGAAITTAAFTLSLGTSSFNYQLGSDATSDQQIALGIGNFGATNATGLNLNGDIGSQQTARAYMATVDLAVKWLNDQQGALGSTQNEITYQVSNLQSMYTNTESAKSTIKDTDYAETMSKFTQSQIAQQAGVAMLSQANQMPQQILSLIKG